MPLLERWLSISFRDMRKLGRFLPLVGGPNLKVWASWYLEILAGSGDLS